MGLVGANPSFDQYFQTIKSALLQKDFVLASHLLRYPLPSAIKPIHPILQSLIQSPYNPQWTTFLQANVPTPYNSITSQFISLLSPQTSLPQKFEEASESFQQFLKHFTPQEGNIEGSILKVLSSNLYGLACFADQSLGSSCKKNVEETARLLSRPFSHCLTDRTEKAGLSSKRGNVLHLVVLLFKCYFKLATLRLCSNIIRAIDQAQTGSGFPPAASFPKSEAISYLYYRARISIHQKEFKAAEDFLSEAFVLCHPQDLLHQREILTYLIILKIIHGVLPKQALLQKYGLENEYWQMTQAVRSGNLMLFEQVLEANQAFFVRKELFLLIQLQLKSLILRNLFRKVYVVAMSLPDAVDSRLPLGFLEVAFRVYGIECVGRDEIECFLAGLIYNGYIKGYMSHEKGVLVLSKKNPFPSPASLFS